MDWVHNDVIAIRAKQGVIERGHVKITENIIEGLENAPEALIGLLAGENKGIRMVRVSGNPT